MRIRRQAIAALAVVALIVGLAGAAFASVSTNQADYSPGSTVTISGDNSNGAGYLPGETVQAQVSGPNGYASSCGGTVAADGTWSCQVTLNSGDSAVGNYSYTATGTQSGVSEQGTFTDAQPVGTTTVTWTGNGLTGGVGTSTCNTTDSDQLNPGPNQKGWLFVLGQISGDPSDWRLTVTFSDGTQSDLSPTNVNGPVAQWAVYSGVNATLNAATAQSTGAGGTSTGVLTVSHCFPNGTPTSSLRTEVHGPNVAETVVPPETVSLGDTVHDAAFVTYANGSLGSDATVTFVLLTGSTDCTTGTAGTPQTVPISGASEAKAESAETAPLAAGDYAYQVTFDSGTSSTLPDQGPKCEPFTVTKAGTQTATQVHDKDHKDITGKQVPLGSVVHDSATVGPQVGTFVISGTVTYSFFTNDTCSGDPTSTVAKTIAADGTVPESPDTNPLTPGKYGYLASYSGDSNYNGSMGVCEPFEVIKADTTTATQVHDAGHQDITGKSVAPGSVVHDNATVGQQVGTFVISGKVTYSYYENGACSGVPKSTEDKTIAADGTVPESTPQQINASGNYAYQATYSGDSNYNASTGACEPFTVFQPGKTMGFWGNSNGQARIDPSGNGSGYLANAQAIGRGSNIDTKAESLKVLPNTLNACGKGSPQIFTVGGSTSSSDCTLAAGINKASLNTLAAQTLALGYNIKLVSGYTGQTIGTLQCSAYVTAGLSSSSTVNQAFTAAVSLINGSASGGTTTQTQIGAMNQLLNCLNREV